jgi:hypothetical protein
VTWSRRERTLFFATVGAVALGAGWFLLANPALTRASSIEKRGTDAGVREKKILAEMRRLPDMVDEIHALENQITASAPSTMETDFHADLKALGEKSGVTPSAVDLVRRQPLREGFEEMILEIRMETDTQHLTDYLYWLENSPRLLRISRLDVSRTSRTKDGEGTLTVSLRLSTVVKTQDPGSSEPVKGGPGEGDKKKGDKK